MMIVESRFSVTLFPLLLVNKDSIEVKYSYSSFPLNTTSFVKDTKNILIIEEVLQCRRPTENSPRVVREPDPTTSHQGRSRIQVIRYICTRSSGKVRSRYCFIVFRVYHEVCYTNTGKVEAGRGRQRNGTCPWTPFHFSVR